MAPLRGASHARCASSLRHRETPLTRKKLCRDRKVRCGGEQPECDKCRRAGEQCVYLPTQKPSKADLAQTVETLQKRLGECTQHISPTCYSGNFTIQGEYLLIDLLMVIRCARRGRSAH